jgi:hypothetical protein
MNAALSWVPGNTSNLRDGGGVLLCEMEGRGIVRPSPQYCRSLACCSWLCVVAGWCIVMSKSSIMRCSDRSMTSFQILVRVQQQSDSSSSAGRVQVLSIE